MMSDDMRFFRVPSMAILLVGALFTSSCENRPTAARDPLALYGDFRAYHVADERRLPNAVFDTVSVYLVGDGVYDDATVKVNGSAIPRVATSGNQALFGLSVPVYPNASFEVDVATRWRTVKNRVIAPATEPQLVSPVSDTVMARSDDVVVRWSGATGGTVGLQLHRLDATGGLGDTLWTRITAASVGEMVIPSGVLSISDTTALLSLWHESTVAGEGFLAGFDMAVGFATRRLVRFR
jgi:hypothetical protein